MEQGMAGLSRAGQSGGGVVGGAGRGRVEEDVAGRDRVGQIGAGQSAGMKNRKINWFS